jgi:hypothetical protein
MLWQALPWQIGSDNRTNLFLLRAQVSVLSYNAEHYSAEVLTLNNKAENKDTPKQKHVKGEFLSVFKDIWR